MITAPRSIAVVEGADSERIQRLLARTVADLIGARVRIAGVTAVTHGLPDRSCSAGILRGIGSDEQFPIYLDEVPLDTSCHLDAEGVDVACASVMRQIANSDLVVLSKFGKLEATQQGLFPAFEAAIAAGRPVLTSVSVKHRNAWHAFAPDAVYLDADKSALMDWWRHARHQ